MRVGTATCRVQANMCDGTAPHVKSVMAPHSKTAARDSTRDGGSTKLPAAFTREYKWGGGSCMLRGRERFDLLRGLCFRV